MHQSGSEQSELDSFPPGQILKHVTPISLFKI